MTLKEHKFAKNSIEKALEEAQNAFDTCNKRVSELLTIINSASAQLEGTVEIDVEKESDKRARLLEQRMALDKERKVILARLSINENSHRNINSKIAETEAIEKKYAWLKALSDTANGDITGKEHIKLETYVQMTYFDRII